MALDQTIHEALQRLTASFQQDFDARLKAAAVELAKSAEEERLAAEAEAMSTLAAEIGTVRAEADQRVAEEAARVRAEAEQAFAEEASRLRSELEAAQKEAEELRHEAARAREQSEQLGTELAEARARLTGVEQAHEELQRTATASSEASERAAAAAREQAEQSIAEAQGQAERAAAELAQARGRLAAAERALEELRSTASGDEQALAQLRESSAEARVEERQERLADFDRLLANLRRLDQAASLSDALTTLAEAVAVEAPRTAILVAAPDGFQPFRMTGFSEIAPRTVTRPEASSLTRGLPFALLPPDHVGFSAPVSVGGQPVAMVYADDCTGREETVPASWPEAVEVLARHAASRLETLTALKTVQALNISRRAGVSPVSTVGRGVVQAATPSTTEDDQSARRFARLLVSEIKLYNEATVRLGRLNRDLFDRLRPEIARARALYEQRVPAHVPARSAYFDDELVQTLADGDPALLGSRH